MNRRTAILFGLGAVLLAGVVASGSALRSKDLSRTATKPLPEDKEPVDLRNASLPQELTIPTPARQTAPPETKDENARKGERSVSQEVPKAQFSNDVIKKREPYDADYYDSWLDPEKYGPNGKAFSSHLDIPIALYEENEDVQKLWYMHRQLWAIREQLYAKDLDWAPLQQAKDWCDTQGYDVSKLWPEVEKAVEKLLEEQGHAVPPTGGEAIQLAINSIEKTLRQRWRDSSSSLKSKKTNS